MTEVTITQATPADLAAALRLTSTKLIEAQHEIDGMALLVSAAEDERNELREIRDGQAMVIESLERENSRLRNLLNLVPVAALALVLAVIPVDQAEATELRVTYSHPAYGQKVVIQESKQCVKDANAIRSRLIWVRDFKAWCGGKRV